MAFLVEIDGDDVSSRVEKVRFDPGGNERATATLLMEGTPPAIDLPIVVYAKDGTTPAFGGFIVNRGVSGMSQYHPHPLVDVKCVGYELVCDWCSISLSYDAPVALEDVLEAIADELAVYGITYTPTTTGITLAPFTWDDIPMIDAIRQLRARVPVLIRFNPDQSITTQEIGSTSAPFSITNSTIYKLDRLKQTDQPHTRYNHVKGKFGPTGSFSTTQRWVSDGVTDEWEVDIPASPGGWHQGYVREVGGSDRTVSTPGGGGYYYWDEADGRGTISIGTGSVAPDETELEWIYTGLYPFTIALGSGSPPKERRVFVPSISEYGPAVEAMTQLLASVDQASVRMLDADTDEDGWDYGQAVTVNTTKRGGIVGSFTVQSLEVEIQRGGRWLTRMQWAEGTQQQSMYQSEWRSALGGGGSSTAIAVMPSGGGSGSGSGVMSPVFLGGIGALGFFAANDWVDVPMAMPHVAQDTFTGRVRVSLWCDASGDGVTVRLLNVTDATTVASSEVVSQSPSEVTFVAAIVATKRYVLQAKRTTGSGQVATSPAQLERAA